MRSRCPDQDNPSSLKGNVMPYDRYGLWCSSFSDDANVPPPERPCSSCWILYPAPALIPVDSENLCGPCRDRLPTCASCGTRSRHQYHSTRDRHVCITCHTDDTMCGRCNLFLTGDPTREIDGRLLCEGCASNALTCAACDRVTMRLHRATGNRRVCRTCAEYSSYCHRCGLYAVAPDRAVTIAESTVCEPCSTYARNCDRCSTLSMVLHNAGGDRSVCNACSGRMEECDACGTYYDDASTFTEAQDNRDICRPCRDSEFTQCDDCEEWHGRWGECQTCNPWSDEDDDYDSDYGYRAHGVHGYSYTPTLKFHAAEGETTDTYLGMELEVEGAGSSAAQKAIEHLGELGYLKEDGSLSSGFEIVTHPMSHKFACESFPWDMLTDLAATGAYSPDSAGIHVHVSRKGFTDSAHQYRWLKLIFRNERGVTKVARRTSHNWARFTEHARADVKKYVAKHGRDRYSAERYQAVNVQNEHTFEVRVFRSSLKKQEVQAALDLVAASVEYTRQLTVPAIVAGGWNWDAFTAWVSEREEYKSLHAEMTA